MILIGYAQIRNWILYFTIHFKIWFNRVYPKKMAAFKAAIFIINITISLISP